MTSRIFMTEFIPSNKSGFSKYFDTNEKAIYVNTSYVPLQKEVEPHLIKNKPIQLPDINEEMAPTKSSPDPWFITEKEENQNSPLQQKKYVVKDSDESKPFRAKWMPDDQVTNCYDCHVEFSIFTRKHHCRICGQVFCWKCSNNYIDGARWNYSGDIRVCNFCNKLSNKNNNKKQQVNEKSLRDLQEIFTHLNQYEIGGKVLAEKQDLSPVPSSTKSNYGDATPDVENPDSTFSEVTKDEFEPLTKLTENSFDHLKRIIEHFCKSQGVDVSISVDLLEKSQNIVHYLNVKEKMDIRNYVKLKTVPGKKMDIIHGIAFRSKLLHRKMKENFVEPKILLLSCPIEFYRTEKYVNLDTLMKQESSYLSMIVDKITENKPDIILCEKSIARIAQDLLLKHNITCMMNVKQKIIKKISHCTGIDIFHSVDEIHNIKSLVDGKRFYKSSDGLFVCESLLPNEITILVDNQKLKNILLYSVFCAYHLRLETEFFLDEQGTITEDTKKVGSHLISISPNVVIPEPIDPNIKLQKKNFEKTTFPPMIYSITNHQNIILLFTKLLKQDSNKPTSDDPEIIVIAYYTENDMSIGNYLEVKCFNKNIIEEALKTIRAYTHSHGRVTISVELNNQIENFDSIHMWSACKKCQYTSAPCSLSESSWKYSFGKFLETTFYNSSIIPVKNHLMKPKEEFLHRVHSKSSVGDHLDFKKPSHSRSKSQYAESSRPLDFIKHSMSTNEIFDPHVICNHSLHQDHVRFFSKRNILVKVEYNPVDIYEIEAPPLEILYEPNITRHGEQTLFEDTMEFVTNALQEVTVECGYPKKESVFSKLSTVPHDIPSLNKFVHETFTDIVRWKRRNINHIKVTLREQEGRIKVSLNDFDCWNLNGCASVKNQILFLEEPTSIIAMALKNEVFDVSQHSLETIMRLDEKFHFKWNWKEEAQEIQCTSYFAKQFAAMRSAMFPKKSNAEDPFIASMSRCKKWKTTGGKSGSIFMKSWDDRFVTKQVSRVELNAFLETGSSYFEYMTKVLFHELPSLLVKILGVYRVSYYKQDGKYVKYDLVVMENLFYNRSFLKTFDLKGSIRNRYQKDSTSVLLDQNLLEIFSGGDPLLVREPSKAMLSMSVYNDTLFLAKLRMMDYSLLVGVDQKTHQLVVGIIDYIRQYTWDKSVETWVKSATIMGSKNEIPTIISPKDYKLRFREAMNRYFVLIPDKYTGLLKLK